MNCKITHYLGFLTVALLVVSCKPKATSDPTQKPVPPLQLAVPAALEDRVGNIDLKTMDADSLLAVSRAAAAKQQYKNAAICQYWYVQKSDNGRYDLACYLAQTKQIEPAFYWLQIAAIEEGVDSQHAQRDEDLESLRNDPRWEKVLQYLKDCNNYFESVPIVRTILILPKGYQKATPIPAVLWLHGMGSRPEDFLNDDAQQYADQMNVALIGVSGTLSRGPRSFVWADDVAMNAKRIRDALMEVSDRVTIREGQIISLGFSQGAQVGLEVAVRQPDEFAGSIVLSPGAQFQLTNLKPVPSLARHGYVLCCGADEHPGNVRLTAMDADWLRQAKAQVIHKPYPGMSAHSFPSDFNARFPEWVKFILKAGKE